MQIIIDGKLRLRQSLEQPTPRGTAARTAQPLPLSSNEESGHYQWIVAILNTTWRVIVCRKGIQWILQTRRGTRNGQSRWDGRSYHRTKGGLLDSVHAQCGPIDAAAWSVLQLLPQRFQEDIHPSR